MEGLTGYTGAPVEDPPDLKKQARQIPCLMGGQTRRQAVQSQYAKSCLEITASGSIIL